MEKNLGTSDSGLIRDFGRSTVDEFNVGQNLNLEWNITDEVRKSIDSVVSSYIYRNWHQ